MTTPSLEHVLQQMADVGAAMRQLQADKQQQVLQAMQRKQLLAALDDPQVRSALRARVQAAAQQIDALATQLEQQRQSVAAAQARVKSMLDTLDDDKSSLATLLAARLHKAMATAAPALQDAGIDIAASAAATGTADGATKKTKTARRKR